MKIKRIIDGKAYNTDTAQKVARAKFTYEKNSARWISVATLYRTKGGAFFTVEVEKPDEAYADSREFVTFKPLSYDAAHKFARGDLNMSAGVELLADGIFPSVPEATDDHRPTASAEHPE